MVALMLSISVIGQESREVKESRTSVFEEVGATVQSVRGRA